MFYSRQHILQLLLALGSSHEFVYEFHISLGTVDDGVNNMHVCQARSHLVAGQPSRHLGMRDEMSERLLLLCLMHRVNCTLKKGCEL